MANLSELIDGSETTVVSDPEKPKETDNGIVDLQSFLSEYKEPATVEKPIEPAPTNAQQPSALPTENKLYPGMPVWYGDNRYYQSGKKQGQLKPPPKNRAGFSQAFQNPNVSVNPETSVMTADAIISGALFLTIINILIPMLFALVHNMVVKDKTKIIDWEMLQIDDKATKQLETLSDKALKHIKIDANPVGVLIFAMLGMYTMQFMTVKMLSKTIKPKENDKMAANFRP